MRLMFLLAGAALGCGSFSAAAPALAGCEIRVVSELRITMDGGAPLVDVQVNGRSARMLLDMAAPATTLSRFGAQELGLTPHPATNYRFTGIGEVPGEIVLDSIKVGNAVAENIDVLVIDGAPSSDRYVGVLGGDFLAHADLDLDVAHGLLRMIKPKDCEGDQVVYWGRVYAAAPILPARGPNDLKIEVEVNGVKAAAQLDSGAIVSAVTPGLASRAGVAGASSSAVFASLAVGDEVIKNAALRIAGPMDEARPDPAVAREPGEAADVWLGADFIRAHRIYVARGQGKIYFSYNGGPIFQTPAKRSPAALAVSAEP